MDCSCLRKIPFLHIKIHYFYFHGALACVLPFLPVHAKEIGISAASVGIIYSMIPLATMVLKPCFGALADHFDNLKSLLLLFVAVVMLTSTLTVSIPRKLNAVSSEIRCASVGTSVYFKPKLNPDCRIGLSKPLMCHMYCSECLSFKSVPPGKNNSIDKVCTKKVVNPADVIISLEKQNGSSYSFNVRSMTLSERAMNTECFVNITFSCGAQCEPKLQECFAEGKQEPEYSSDQFWLFLIFAMMCVSLSGVATSFSDAICFNELGERSYMFGRQRLWGTIGWGLLCPLAGYLNDLITGESFLKAYMPGAILLVALLLYDLCIINKLKTKNLKFSQNILKDVGLLLRQFKVLAFVTSVLVIGAFTALMWSYLFWYLVTLGATKTILGVVPAVQCFLGELVFFFFSGRIISSMGHFNVLTLNFICFGVRFIAYSYITEPWMVLPIELLQGPTYGLFYATMASFAHVTALPGTEVTMQGLVGSAFELGMVVGNLLGGFSMQNTSGQLTFYTAGILSLAYGSVNIVVTLIVIHFQMKAIKKRDVELPDMDPVPVEERSSFM